MSKRLKHRLRSVAVVAALLILPQVVQERYFLHIVVMAGIYTIMTMSWNLLAGYSGQLNLGHAAFFGIGAYSSALLAMKLGVSPWFGLLGGGVIAGFFGFLLGFPALRLSGPYLAITTIGFAEILRLVAVNWVDLTRGSLGLSGIPLLTPIRLGSWGMEFYFERDYYYVVLAAVVFTYFCMLRFTHSEFGVSLQALRDDEQGAQSIGIHTSQYKLAVFTISAFFAGMAGGLFAHFTRLVSPDTMSLHVTFDTLTMTMIGGLGTTAGPILGAVLLSLLSEWLRTLEDFFRMDIRLVLYGFLLILTIRFMREGLVGVVRALKEGFSSYGKGRNAGGDHD
ncbi:MAG: branched-chain amino acid ABC transporter permease [Deltaproteobacteria bacterium]|nr:branched-chain amino acid ABC transporter permease [Deltaproteobacteria bacterium]